MDRPQIHYEVHAQHRPGGAFTLECACEARGQAIETAGELIDDRRAIAVKVSKEQLDPRTGEFSSVIVFERGAPQAVARRRPPQAQTRTELPCVTPQDLYTLHARETIGRLLEPWLARAGVTAWELIHRADLLERLEASPSDLQRALQKIAAPECQASGRPSAEVARAYQALVERGIERVRKDEKREAFPDLTIESLAEAAQRLKGHGDSGYLLSGAVAKALAGDLGWDGKVERLLDLAETALASGEAGAPALAVLEQPLAELLESRAGLRDLLGVEGDLGDDLGALIRLVAGAEIEALSRFDVRLAGRLPMVAGAAARLSRFFDAGAFAGARRAVGRRVLRELNGPCRLRPASAVAEIELLRTLATALTATGGRLVDQDDVRQAFVDRSRGLLAPDFLSVYLADRTTASGEAEALVRLAENVAGPANKRQAARLLNALLLSPRLETELRGPGEPPAARLAALARMQTAVLAAGFQPEDSGPLAARLGELGAAVEDEVKLISALLRADADDTHKLFLLTKLASGESAPAGPVADRARAEALKLMRRPEARDRLAASPELRARLLALLPAAA